jgi:hypothetical protein
MLKFRIITLQLIPFKFKKITIILKRVNNKVKSAYAKATLPIRVKLIHLNKMRASHPMLHDRSFLMKAFRGLVKFLKSLRYLKYIFKIEFAVTVMAIAVLFNFSVLVYERYELKLYQRKTYQEAKSFIRAYTKAYGFGAEKITVQGKDYDITEPPMYISETYKGSDKHTNCTIIIKSRIKDNRPVFDVSEPHNHCFDLITYDRSFHTWKTQLFDGR